MSQPIAFIIVRGTGNDWYFLPILFAFGLVSMAAVRWSFFLQWIQGIRGRDWGTMSAVIDIVSVLPKTIQGRGGEQIVGYVGTLTYFYRNPDLQSGDYSSMFNTETEAREWADSYKGSSVTVHVDARDPTRSVLRKEEL